MPLYEYICEKCKAEFVLLQKVGTSEKDTECPRCGSKELKKKVSSFSCSIGGSYSFGSGSYSGGT